MVHESCQLSWSNSYRKDCFSPIHSHACTHTHKLNWAKLKAKKDLQLEKAGLMPSQDELSCHTKKNTIWTLTPGPHPRCGPIQKEMI